MCGQKITYYNLNNKALKNQFESKTTEQLKANLNMLKGIVWALAIVLILLVGVTTYGFVVKEDKSPFIALFAVAFSCCGILPLQFISMNKIKAELKLRENADQYS